MAMSSIFHGDVLEAVVGRVAAPDLAATAQVSREWLRAVRAVLRRRPRRLPCLIVHLIDRRGARRRASAYDPRSGAWLSAVSAPAAPLDATATPSNARVVVAATGDRVCWLSPSGLAIAADALGTTAAALGGGGPGVWRVDPVLAAVGGGRVVALGGACRLALAEGEDAAAVEVHECGAWAACDPMPAELRDSAAATWLSAAATERRVYLVERATGLAAWFDPAARRWGPARRPVAPDAAVTAWAVAPGGCAGAGERVVLFGAKRSSSRVVSGGGVRVLAWEVDGESLEPTHQCRPTDDAMPAELAERLFLPRDEDEEGDGEEDLLDHAPPLSIGVCGNAVGGYVYNAAEPANGAVLYELREEEEEEEGISAATVTAVARWEWVPCAPALLADPLARAMLACSPIGPDELALAVAAARKSTLKLSTQRTESCR